MPIRSFRDTDAPHAHAATGGPQACREAISAGPGAGRRGRGGVAGGEADLGAGREGTAGGAEGGLSRAGGGRTPSVRQSGRSRRPACGAAAISAAISGSASRCCSCAPYAAASGTRRGSQAKQRGNRRYGGRGRWVARRGEAERRAAAVPAGMRAARAAKRPARRLSRAQMRMISGPASRPPALRAATARRRPSMMRASRSAGVGGESVCTIETLTQRLRPGQARRFGRSRSNQSPPSGFEVQGVPGRTTVLA